MKKFYSFLFAAVALVGFAACNSDSTEEPAPAGVEKVSFKANIDTTKTDLDGLKTIWCEGDTVVVNKTYKFICQDDLTTFTCTDEGCSTLLGEKSVTAVYSHNSDGLIDSKAGKAGSVLKATGNLNEGNLSFQIESAFLKFTTTGAVTLKGAGLFSTGDTFEVTGAVTDMYVAINPTADVVAFSCESNGVTVKEKPIKFDVCKIYNLGELQPAAASEWTIVGGHNGWAVGTGTKMYKDVSGLLVARNVTLETTGFKFVKNNSWNTQIGGQNGNDTPDENVTMQFGWYRSYINYNNHKDHICVSDTSKKYDIYLSLYGGGANNTEVRFYVAEAGTEVYYLALRGQLNGDSWTKDVLLLPFKNDILSAKGVKFNGEFKIKRAGESWDDSWSNGLTCVVGTKYSSFTSGSNMKIAAGTYDVYVQYEMHQGLKNVKNLWIMKEGNEPTFN